MDNRSYYQNLLIIQYHDKINAKATIGAMYDTVIPKNSVTGNNLLEDIRDAFNLDTAVGAQLDILGYYIGVNRLYQGQNFETITAFGYTDQYGTDYNDVVGFSLPDTFLIDDGTFLSNSDIVSTTNKLNDNDYRLILKIKAAQNNCDYSYYSIETILYTFFGTELYFIDNQNMTISYYINGQYMKLSEVLNQKGLLLKPMGVAIDNIYEFDYIIDEDNNYIIDEDNNKLIAVI